MELGTQTLKRQLAIAFRIGDVHETRCFLDSLVVGSPESEIDISQIIEKDFRGHWLVRRNAETRVTLLYCHGGGYSFYPGSYTRFLTLITRTAKSRTFALDYRLSPEHRFPAQLEDALHAYRWLLGIATKPENLVLAGDSAGGHLTLALLLAVRDAKLPLPALAVALSPPTGFEEGERPGIIGDQGVDWINRQMLEQWTDWFCDLAQRRNPLVSPLLADLRGLPPIYIQAGRAEILYPTIQAFADGARNQGADVVLEAWEDMNHVFQMFGPYVPQSGEALRRLGEVVQVRTQSRERAEAVSAANS
jgi:acetyl esterase/lipase